MGKFIKSFGSKLKKVLGIALLSALLVQTILPATAKAAPTPQFNFLGDDYELLRGANKSAGETVWHDPIDGKAGDTFAGIIYYHNGIVDSVAHNTKIKVNLPAETTNGKAVLSASISADNASTVTDTVIKGKVKDLSGLTVNLDQDAKLSLIPGSVQWFPNFNSDNTPAQPLLFDQTGAELTKNGLNIGDINGCWQYIGYVVFQFKTEKKEVPAPVIEKSKIAKNLTTSEEGVNIKADAGDEILYTLTTKNTGNGGTDFTVSDDISDILKLADFKEASLGGQVSGSTVTYPSVNLAAGDSIVRTFKVKVKNPLPVTDDFVMTNVYGNTVNVTVTKVVPGQPNIDKTVRNVTLGETSYVKENQAKAGDTLEYQIVANLGQKMDDPSITDVLPANVQFIAGSATLTTGGNTRKIGDELFEKGASLRDVVGNERVVIKFKVKIASGLSSGEIIINNSTLHLDKETLTSQAKTKIVAAPVVTPPAEGKLPMTGPETPILLMSLLSAAGALGFKFMKARQLLAMLGR